MFLPEWTGSKCFSVSPASSLKLSQSYSPCPPPSTTNSKESLMQLNDQLSEPKVERKKGSPVDGGVGGEEQGSSGKKGRVKFLDIDWV